MTVTVRCFGRVLKPHSHLSLKTYLIVASYTPGCIVAGSAQILLSLTTPIFCFWCTMIILFVYLNSQNQLISTDSLTGLHNRNQLESYLLSQHDSIDHYVIMVDVDKFKQINDTYGHVEGDRALELVSKALKNACSRLGKSAFLCRYGGDEFLMVVPTEMPGIAVRVIETCVKEEVSNRPASLTYAVNVSLGYALWNGKASSFKQSVAEADLMMYEDKRS
jgi:diguanylate cyclase (GGDEF)-like protein